MTPPPPGPHPPAARRGYHHGDLREALIQVAIELLGERGTFSMAEASRRLGVAASAPYRHFADRDDLLAAVALRAADLLSERLGTPPADNSPPEQRLVAAARTYVRFAADQRPLFQALSGSGFGKDSHPDVARAGAAIGTVFLSPAAELTAGDEAAAARLASAIVATAHGHAILMLDGTFGAGRPGVEAAAGQAAAATLALIHGRESLSP
jgi:AcrR family transcriptional regulator